MTGHKKCPFCNGEPELVDKMDYQFDPYETALLKYIQCTKCFARTRDVVVEIYGVCEDEGSENEMTDVDIWALWDERA